MPPLAYDLLDALMDGQLADFIDGRRAEKASWDSIAHDLSTEHGVHINGETIRRWTLTRDTATEGAA